MVSSEIATERWGNLAVLGNTKYTPNQPPLHHDDLAQKNKNNQRQQRASTAVDTDESKLQLDLLENRNLRLLLRTRPVRDHNAATTPLLAVAP